MNVKVLKPGNKVDLRLLSQIEANQEKESQEEILVFKSQIYDLNDNGRIQMAIPMLGGEMIRFPAGAMLEALFYTNSAVYKGHMEVTSIVKDGNMPVLQGLIRNKLEKYQRRQYYRLDKMIDVSYSLTEQSEEDTGSQDGFLATRYQEATESVEIYQASTINISGGGMKLLTSSRLEKGQRVLLDFLLGPAGEREAYHVLGEVIESSPIEGVNAKFVTRVQFLSLSESKQEQIIKYIFNEERRQLWKKG